MQYLKKSQLYDSLFDEYQRRTQIMTGQRQALESLQLLVNLIDDQVPLEIEIGS